MDATKFLIHKRLCKAEKAMLETVERQPHKDKWAVVVCVSIYLSEAHLRWNLKICSHCLPGNSNPHSLLLLSLLTLWTLLSIQNGLGIISYVGLIAPSPLFPWSIRTQLVCMQTRNSTRLRLDKHRSCAHPILSVNAHLTKTEPVSIWLGTGVKSRTTLIAWGGFKVTKWIQFCSFLCHQKMK